MTDDIRPEIHLSLHNLWAELMTRPSYPCSMLMGHGSKLAALAWTCPEDPEIVRGLRKAAWMVREFRTWSTQTLSQEEERYVSLEKYLSGTAERVAELQKAESAAGS